MKTLLIICSLLIIPVTLLNAAEFDKSQVKDSWLYGTAKERKAFDNIINKEVTVEFKPERLKNIDSIPDDFFKGKYTLIDIWATWCNPCLAGIPENNEIYEKYKDKLNLIAICTSKGQADFEKTVHLEGIKYPTGVDANHKIIKYFKVAGYPTYHLIDPDGKFIVADIKAEHVMDVLNLVFKE